MLKKLKCQHCRKAFSSNEDNSIFPVVKLVNNQNKGKLIYNNVKLFEILQGVDKLIHKYINDSEMYFKILDDIEANVIKLSFRCEEHKVDLIPQLIHEYILIRMLQYSRLIRRETVKDSKFLKKEAKLNKN